MHLSLCGCVELRLEYSVSIILTVFELVIYNGVHLKTEILKKMKIYEYGFHRVITFVKRTVSFISISVILISHSLIEANDLFSFHCYKFSPQWVRNIFQVAFGITVCNSLTVLSATLMLLSDLRYSLP